MVYAAVDPNEPITQGDIFFDIPFTTTDLNNLVFSQNEDDLKAGKWSDIDDKNNITLNLNVIPTCAIVLSQDCDAGRAPSISLFRVEPLSKILKENTPKSAKAWADYIKRLNRDRPSIFYLPKDLEQPNFKVGFSERMFVNLETVFQIERSSLDEHKGVLRRGRLIPEAYEHYREAVAQYFRRYPYEEHYPMTKEEVDAYEEGLNDLVKRRPYQ